MRNQTHFLVATVLAVTFSAGLAAETQAPAASPDAPTPVAAFSADDPGLSWGPCPDFLPAGCGIAVLHGDPAGDNADIFFRVPAGSAIARHWHSSTERMVLVSGELEVTYDGRKPAMLRPGMYAHGPARLPHSAVCSPAAACVLFIAFDAPVDALAGGPAD